MNEYFERKPIRPHIIEKLQDYIVVARFKIIEVTQLLKSDHILAESVVDPDKPVVVESTQAELQKIKPKKLNYF